MENKKKKVNEEIHKWERIEKGEVLFIFIYFAILLMVYCTIRYSYSIQE